MTTKRKPITVCDSETDPFLHGRVPEPFIWGWYDGDNYETFDTTYKFVEFVKDKPQVCYCHNGGRFDFFFMSEFWQLLEPLMIINGRIARFKIGECEFRDSYCILPVPLSKFGNKREIDYAKLEARVRHLHMDEIRDYLYQDCVGLYGGVIRNYEEYGLTLTVAGSAMKVWAEMNDTKPPKTTEAFYKKFAAYYYGGRVECFHKGVITTPFSSCDINSAYPRAMIERHPYGSNWISGQNLPSTDEALARSFITLTAKSLGAFPYRDGTNLTFPTDGEYRTFTITGHEFMAARDTATLVLDEVTEVHTFIETIDFKSYVDRFYAQKAACKELGDTVGYELAKLRQNGLYGKFGANPERYEEFTICAPEDVYAMSEVYGYGLKDYIGEHAIVARPISEYARHYYNVATAASITGWVRAYLWRSMRQCKDVYYVDTDNIKARDTSRLPIGKELGQWSLESTNEFGAFAGKKLYATLDTSGKWRIASKGAKLTAQQIVEIARGGKILYARDVPTFSLKNGVRFVDRTIQMT